MSNDSERSPDTNNVPTDVVHAEVALAEARRRTDAIAHFARRLSHDLSNMLTVIRTYSELVLAEIPERGSARNDLEEIRQAADSIVAYLQRASAFSRSSYVPTASTAIDALLADVVALATSLGRGPIALHGASQARVTASAAPLADAMQELLANARDASPPGVAIEVSSACKTLDAPIIDGGVLIGAGTWVVINVRDEGPGLHASVREAAFDPYVSTKAGVRGAGLGLSIARSAIWAAGGQITLVRDGLCTVARVYLPSISGE